MAPRAPGPVVLADEKRSAGLMYGGVNVLPATPDAALPPAAKPTEEMKAKVVLAGAPGVGKSSLVRRYVLNEFADRYLHTLGVIVYKRAVVLEVWPGRVVRVTMTLWDTMGRGEEDDLLHDIDLFNAQGVLAVCDVTDAGTVSPLRARMEAALRAAGDVPTQILLNKADLGAREDARTEGLRTGRDHGAPCYLTSAKAGDNVVAAFGDLARRIVERQLLPAAMFDSVDRRILDAADATAVTIEHVASAERISSLFAEARLERLRRTGFLQFAALDLDPAGRPVVSYGRTQKASPTVRLEVPA